MVPLSFLLGESLLVQVILPLAEVWALTLLGPPAHVWPVTTFVLRRAARFIVVKISLAYGQHAQVQQTARCRSLQDQDQDTD